MLARYVDTHTYSHTHHPLTLRSCIFDEYGGAANGREEKACPLSGYASDPNLNMPNKINSTIKINQFGWNVLKTFH